jgi:diaminohydroxyphosphoribosylaminopyrimidine deaminase / 5-amino-6-(5-phosphoribosylamino)uracil reductase
MEQNYKKYMQRCIDLAQNGRGSVAPNPMVGAVVLHNGEVIGEGYHKFFGGAHAEVNAIRTVINQELLPQCTLFVSLEPCSHKGKTPPCSDLIIEKRIKKVVVGTVDPNSLVAGKGIEKLRNAGIEVVENVLEKECFEFNKRFFTFHKLKRPYLILKWAESKDGYIDIVRQAGTPIGPNWISNQVSRMLVHKWRSEEQSIMVGTNTVAQDNPSLNTRLWPGKSPVRIVLDRNGRLSNECQVFDQNISTLVFTETIQPSKENLEYITIQFTNDLLQQIVNELFAREIQSVIIEGGTMLLQSFIDENLWDEARVFKGTKNFINGIKAPQLNCADFKTTRIFKDTLFHYINNSLSEIIQ